MVCECAANKRNSDGRPKGRSCGCLLDDYGIWVPRHQCLNPCLKLVGSIPQRIDAGQYGVQVPTTDKPTDGADEVRMVAKGDYALFGKDRMDIEMRSLHTR